MSNKGLLSTVTNWFHAKKVKPIWAIRLLQDTEVATREGSESAKAGDYICRGVAEEEWPQTEAALLKKYNATGELNPAGWQKFMPKPDGEGVMAAQVNHEFKVQATWGVLTGKAGDYVVKPFSALEDPADLWIVDQDLFNATYEVVK